MGSYPLIKNTYKKYPGGDVAGLQAELERLASLASPDKVVKNMLQKIRFSMIFRKLPNFPPQNKKKFSCNLCTTPNVIF